MPRRPSLLVGLLAEVAVLDHAGELDDAPQGDLAPLAAHFGLAQSGDQITGLGLQSLLGAAHVLELRADAAEGLLAVLFDLADLLLSLLEGL